MTRLRRQKSCATARGTTACWRRGSARPHRSDGRESVVLAALLKSEGNHGFASVATTAPRRTTTTRAPTSRADVVVLQHPLQRCLAQHLAQAHRRRVAPALEVLVNGVV